MFSYDATPAACIFVALDSVLPGAAADSGQAVLLPMLKTRLIATMNTHVAMYNAMTGLFGWENLGPVTAAINAAYNGDTSPPGETWVVAAAGVSVSVFMMDFDAPSIEYTDLVFEKVEGLFGGSANEARYSKSMVEERLRKREVS